MHRVKIMKDKFGNTANTPVFQEVRDDVTRSHFVLSDDAAISLQYVFFTVMCQPINIFGVGANVINIICFVKQGFQDPINISLLGLAISDIGCLSTLIWTCICYTPAVMAADLPFDSIELQYLITGMPHTVFTRVTAWITGFITLERCLCITLPLKVKTIITPRRVSCITAFIFIILISSIIPEYIVTRLDWKYFPKRNKTLIGLVYTEDRERVTKVSYLINNVLTPFSSFFVVIVCTALLVINLQHNTSWRKKSTTISQAANVSYRNQKVSKMVVMVSTLFITCFVPMSFMFLGMSLESEFFIGGKYRNLFVALAGLSVVPEAINSSLNIFIYYKMSTRYRIVFHTLFSRSK